MKFILSLFLIVFFVHDVSAAPGNACADLFSAADAQAVSKKISRIRRIIESDFDGLVQHTSQGKAYLSFGLHKVKIPQFAPQFHYGEYRWVIDDLLELTAERKAVLYRQLKQKYPDIETKIPREVLLCFDDSTIWEKEFELTMSDVLVQSSYSMADPDGGYYDQIQKLSPEIKTKLLKKIGSAYPSAAKEGVQYGLNPPKRQLDAWIRAIIGGDQIFQDAFASAGDPLIAYDTYLQSIRDQVIANMPKEKQSEYGILNASDIIALAREAQKYLFELGTVDKNLVIKDEYGNVRDYGPVRFLFHGSITKGLAKSGSDLDMGIPALREIRWGNLLKGTWGSANVTPLPTRLKTIAEKLFPNLRLVIQTMAHDFNDIMGFAAPLEPIMVEATATDVYIIVLKMNASGEFQQIKYRVP